MPDLTSKKILFADVDDTVCHSTRPVEADMAQALNQLIDRGWKVAFISGSTVDQLWGQFGGKLRIPYHLLGASGTVCVEVTANGLQTRYQASLTGPERKALAQVLVGFAARHGIVSLTTQEDQIQDRVSQMTFSALGRHAPEILKRSFDPFGTLREAWAEELRRELGPGYGVGVGGTTSIDITRAGFDKGWGIREFLKVHRLRAEDAVFFGDKLRPGGNDFPARAVVDCIEVTGVQDTLQKLRALAPDAHGA